MIRGLLVLLTLCAGPLSAGLWDSDRPEALPDSYDLVSGKFDRPDEPYYEARIRRLSPTLESDLALESRLVNYDDVAVARMRLGQYADAIILIDRKSQLLETIRRDRTSLYREHRIRALANKAAFLVQRWRSSERADASDLRSARELLELLVQEDAYNADARWSLAEVTWLLDPPAFREGEDPVFPNLLQLRDAAFRGTREESTLARNGIAGCLAWLERVIAYENGWTDVDILHAYSLALYLSGRPEESLFAWFRLCELIDAGSRSVVRGSPEPRVLKRLMGVHQQGQRDLNVAREVYNELRKGCDRWHESRTVYMRTQIAEGMHPDTHAGFWSGWKLDTAGEEAATREEREAATVSPMLLLGGFGGLALVLVAIFGATIFMSRKGRAPSVDEL